MELRMKNEAKISYLLQFICESKKEKTEQKKTK